MHLAVAVHAGFAGDFAPRAVPLFSGWHAHDARHHGRYGQKDSFALIPCSDMCKAGIAGDNAPCAVFARMRGWIF